MIPPEPRVLRVASILAGRPGRFERAASALGRLFGPVLLRGGPYPFDMSAYYGREMGPGLFRIWLAFSGPARPEDLARWKTACASVEDAMRERGGRTVNIDPGYLDLGKLVLASFKEAPDKIFMGSGVWAHTCMRYRFGGFEAPDHSFPDFADGRFDPFLREARLCLKRLLRTGGIPAREGEGS